MFNIGGGEMIVIFLLALLVLGPERLPKAMGQVGRAVAQMRKLSSGFQDEIRRAMDPIEAPFRPGQETLKPAITDEVRVVNTEPAPDPVALAKPEADLAPPPELDEPADPDAPVAVEPATETLVVASEPEPEPAPVPEDQTPPRTGSVTPLRPRIEDVDEATG
jgi:Tat protein translocase TatB subunit